MGFVIGAEENDEVGWDRIIEDGSGGADHLRLQRRVVL
jgi:hypothetical protein